MANCDNLFKTYNNSIKLSDDKREILRQVRDNLRHKIQMNISEVTTDEKLEFHSQGSFVMDTIIKPKDDDFDLDDGVYFLGNKSRSERPSPQELHKAILDAVGQDENYADVLDKETCVRVRYEKEKFHIDIPVYYADNIQNPDLAYLPDIWILSNPIEFIAWFEKKIESGFKEGFLFESQMFDEYQNWLLDIRKKDAQLRRIVRYLKGWADELRGDMPPGIVMTILAAQNYKKDDRDDLSLCNTLEAIMDYLNKNGFKCPRPTTPINEDLFASYSETKKNYFKDRLNTFITSAKQAINSDNQKEACLKWQKHLGERFPCSLAKNSIEGAIIHNQRPIIGSTARSAKE